MPVKKMSAPITKSSSPKSRVKAITDVTFYLGELTSSFTDRKTGITKESKYNGMQIAWKENGEQETWNMGTTKADVLSKIATDPKFVPAIVKYLESLKK